MRSTLYTLCAFVALTLAGCASTTTGTAPTTSPVMQPASPVPTADTTTATSSSTTTTDDPAVAVARDWAARWCGWDWQKPHGAREASAREVMTPEAGRDLPGTDVDTWRSEVVGTHETATCGPATVQFSDGPRTDTRAYVSISAERTVRSDQGLTPETWRDDRRVVAVDGRWLVDVPVTGG